MPYKLKFTKIAEKDILHLKKNEPLAYRKLWILIDEVCTHPYSDKGKPKPLSGNRAGQWSRRVTKKHRLVYIVSEKTVTIIVISAAGHYDDK